MSAELEPLRIRSVLVPLDGSPLAEQALPWAMAIAREARARLRLVLVHQVPSPPPLDEATVRLYTKVELTLRKSQRDYLHQTATRIKKEASVQTATAVLEGAPGPALTRYAGELGTDLVVMTTHGRGGFQRVWLGSVADHLLRTLNIPMLLVRSTEDGSPTTGLKRILVALDGSRRAEAILPAALAMASIFHASLALLQVVHPVMISTDPPTSFPTEFDEQLTAIQRREGQDYLDDMAEELTGTGIEASGAAVLGSSAFEALHAAARERGTGMVALTTHGRTGLRRMVLGSLADKLVRAGELPVLITRPRGR